MRKILAVFLSLLSITFALAADNTVILDPGTTVIMRTQDVGSGVQSPYNILGNITGTTIYGTAGTSNNAVLTIQGIASGTNLPTSHISGSVASGAYASGSIASGALASGSIASGAMVDLGAQADAACATDNGTCSLIALTKRTNQDITTLNTTAGTGTGNTGAAVPAAAIYMGFNSGGNLTGPSLTAPLPVNNTGPYPIGATPYTATATGTTGATTATLAGASSVTTYLCGFSIRANATAAATGNATVTGVITATMNFTQWTAPNTSGLGITEMIFAPCIPASGTNQSVAVVSAAPGTGGVVSVTAWGYKL